MPLKLFQSLQVPTCFSNSEMQVLRVCRIVPYSDLGVCITVSRKDFFFFLQSIPKIHIIQMDPSCLICITVICQMQVPDEFDLLGLYMCICYIQKYEFSKRVPKARLIDSVSLGSLMGTREIVRLSSILSPLKNLETSTHIGQKK